MLRDGDRLGALLTALMLRHRDPEYAKGRVADLFMELRAKSGLDTAMATEGDNFVFAPYEDLLDELRHKLGDNPGSASS